MNSTLRPHWVLWLLVLLALAVGCSQDVPTEQTALTTATPGDPVPTAVAVPTRDPNFIVIATDAPQPPFTRFDEYGSIEGFNDAVMENIASVADFDYEFVVTPFQGVLDILSTGVNTDFDAVMSTLLVPETPRDGIVYTDPYLEVGQVMMVLADENELQNYNDLRPGMAVGAQYGSQAEQTAREILQVSEDDLFDEYERLDQVVQALIDETVNAIVIDSYSAEYFAEAFPQQLKIVGGNGRDAWITSKAYAIAVSDQNSELLEKLNSAIAQLEETQVIDSLTVAWLVLDELPPDSIDPGESRVGTPTDEFFIGIVGSLNEMDPATLAFDFINWEVMRNTMSGLYMFNADNQLQPVLAEDSPTVSEDKLEYTIRLRQGLQFPDGSEFTADDVAWSVIRASRLGNFLVNGYLQDANEDNFADFDAVQIVDPYTVKFILQAPTAFFPSLLATPPYYPISSECYAETADPGSTCAGIGPYSITNWTDDRMRLKANPQYPGEPQPAFENLVLRFYSDPLALRKSLTEFQSIDLAWTGLPYADYVEMAGLDNNGDGTPDFLTWDGPGVFKSYLIFEQSQPPWNNRLVREAASYAIDREALVRDVFAGRRLPLLSPVPDAVPGHVSTLPSTPDVEQVRALMLQAGYTPENPLEITIWFVNDGRYSDVEEQYINAIARQLDATGVFRVTTSGAPWDQFRVQIAECSYPAYLLGWPSPGQPTNYLDPSAWTDFFVTDTDRTFCSNFQSTAMDALVEATREELDPTAREALYAEMQALWATELPTLDITQEPRRALSLSKVNNVQMDALGLLHYQLLSKETNGG